MKLVTYLSEGHPRHGVVVGDEILDLHRAFVALERDRGGTGTDAEVIARYGADMLGFIERQGVALPAAHEAVHRGAQQALPLHVDGLPLRRPIAGTHLLAPIPRPPSMRDGYAFRQHVLTARRNRGLEMIPEFDQFPVFYFTNHHGVVGPGEVRVMPKHLERLDFELETAVVVGRRGRNLSIAQADDAIFGMMVMNDLSARALQMEEMKLNLGPAKGKDFATALGPWLVTLDELADRTRTDAAGRHFDLRMTAVVNGVQVSDGNLKDMSWTFAQILERASYGVDLHPGDVVGSGTCGTGCFLELNGSKVTNDQWLRLGDEVVLEVERLGRLQNTFALET
jgi:fumarylacetoacetate (FAA) hydrolase